MCLLLPWAADCDQRGLALGRLVHYWAKYSFQIHFGTLALGVLGLGTALGETFSGLCLRSFLEANDWAGALVR